MLLNWFTLSSADKGFILVISKGGLFERDIIVKRPFSIHSKCAYLNRMGIEVWMSKRTIGGPKMKLKLCTSGYTCVHFCVHTSSIQILCVLNDKQVQCSLLNVLGIRWILLFLDQTYVDAKVCLYIKRSKNLSIEHYTEPYLHQCYACWEQNLLKNSVPCFILLSCQ